MAFEHLPFKLTIQGDYRSPYGKDGRRVIIPKGIRTVQNEENRAQHGGFLSQRVSQLKDDWSSEIANRIETGMPDIPDAIPLFLQIDPNVFQPEQLRGFGIEIISEEEDGFLIGASADIELKTLQEKIQKFINEQGQKNTAQLWDIVTGKNWRIDRILSKPLLKKWDSIEDSELITLDVAIACFIHISDFPPEKEGESEKKRLNRIKKWEAKKREADILWDETAMKRQNEIENFVLAYNGIPPSGYVNSADSFSCRLSISGKGLKDFVLNYPYVFEVDEYDDLKQELSEGELNDDGFELEIQEPDEDAATVCVIDSGIQENHRLIAPSIKSAHSLSYVPVEATVTSDQVLRGGHGTRVSGAVLYPKEIPDQGTVRLAAWIQNARVLDSENKLDRKLFPAELVKEIVQDFHETYGTRIFNMSIASKKGYRQPHMSKWAESIDRRTWENDVLFILAAGNIESLRSKVGMPPGIIDYLESGKNYPEYLLEYPSRIADPAHSQLSLSVGSICHDEFEDDDVCSFGKNGFPSSFSRTGLGIWGTIKPEVVEFGGDWIYEKADYRNLSQRPNTSIDLVRSTLHGGPSKAKDGIGTSFAAPKVASIAAELQRLFPEESTLLYKTLIIQSARWPDRIFKDNVPRLNFLRLYGYGLPNLERATGNNDWRVTLVNSGSLAPKKADIYEVQIPKSLRRQGDRFDILIEVTLVFKAEPRRTRAGFRSYMSGWLDWHSSKLGEGHDVFRERMLDEISLDSEFETNEEATSDTQSIPWVIQQRKNSGIPEVRLNHSASQKDWAILKSHALSESFCLAVVGHKGWDKDLRNEIPYSIAVSFEALNLDIEIYEEIRIHNEVEVRV
ncbi:MAG: S8 family peptidase [Salibacteraceae bacterium]